MPTIINQIQTVSDLVLLRNTSLRELTDDADIISEIIPVKFTDENKYMKVPKVKVIKTHKGQQGTGDIVYLSVSVGLDKEYLVYLRNMLAHILLIQLRIVLLRKMIMKSGMKLRSC